MIGESIRLFIAWLLLSIGMWKLAHKMDWKKKWMAWVPGLRYLGLADDLEMHADGINCAILEILYYMTSFLPVSSDNRRLFTAFTLLVVVIGVALYVYRIRIFLRLLHVFDLKKPWLVLWLLADWIAIGILGFSDKYQPRENISVFAGMDAGFEPMHFSAINDLMNEKTPSQTGLSVLLQERTVSLLGKKKYLLKDIAMDIPNGSMVLLLGGSGAGKTTLINAIIGYEPAKAEIRLNGKDVYKQYDSMKYQIGFVTQKNLMRGDDTVRNTITDSAKLRIPLQKKKAERKERIDEVLETLGLSPVDRGLVSKMSGGQLRRIAIGMELVSDPALFVLDEPDSGLDGVIARELFTKLREIADSGKIVIVITHTPDRVIDLFDKVIVLAKDSGRVGRLAFYGSPAEARDFFGRDTMEEIVRSVNRKEEGGEGLADEFIEKYALREAAGQNAGQNAGQTQIKDSAEKAEAGAGAEAAEGSAETAEAGEDSEEKAETEDDRTAVTGTAETTGSKGEEEVSPDEI